MESLPSLGIIHSNLLASNYWHQMEDSCQTCASARVFPITILSSGTLRGTLKQSCWGWLASCWPKSTLQVRWCRQMRRNVNSPLNHWSTTSVKDLGSKNCLAIGSKCLALMLKNKLGPLQFKNRSLKRRRQKIKFRKSSTSKSCHLKNTKSFWLRWIRLEMRKYSCLISFHLVVTKASIQRLNKSFKKSIWQNTFSDWVCLSTTNATS